MTAPATHFIHGLAAEPAGRTFPPNRQTVLTQPAQTVPVRIMSAGRAITVITNPAILVKKTVDRALITGVRFIEVVIQTAALTARSNLAIRNAAVPVAHRLARRCRAKAVVLTVRIPVPTVAAAPELVVRLLRQRPLILVPA